MNDYNEMVRIVNAHIGTGRVDYAKVYRALDKMGVRPWRGIADANDAATVITAGHDVRAARE